MTALQSAQLDRLAQRKQWRGELDRLTTETEREARRLAREAEPHEANVRRLEAELAHEKSAALSIRARANELGVTRDREVARLSWELQNTASSQVDAGLNYLRSEEATLMRAAVGVHRKHDIFGKVITLQSEGPSVARRLGAIRKALADVSGLKLEALDEIELNGRINRILESLPAVRYEPTNHEAA